jgi:hypothetical protein
MEDPSQAITNVLNLAGESEEGVRESRKEGPREIEQRETK